MSAEKAQVLNDLISDYKSKMDELRGIEAAIKLIATKYGLEYELPVAGGEGAPAQAGRKIRPDQFFGKTQLDSAEEYLRMIGHACSVEEILKALTDGGMKFDTKNPRANLYTQMVRSTMRFAKLPQGSFGLLEWYPKEKEKRLRRAGGTGGEAEEVEEAVLDDDVEPEADAGVSVETH